MVPLVLCLERTPSFNGSGLSAIDSSRHAPVLGQIVCWSRVLVALATYKGQPLTTRHDVSEPGYLA